MFMMLYNTAVKNMSNSFVTASLNLLSLEFILPLAVLPVYDMFRHFLVYYFVEFPLGSIFIL